MQIPYLSFDTMHRQIKAEIIQAFEKFYDDKIYVSGPCVKKFEEDYAAFNDVKFAVGVSNGLDALLIALKSLGIQEGDEVIIPSNTYIATALAVTYSGAKIMFAEPDPQTCNIDPSVIESLISNKTKAIIPVHLYGNPCNMEKIVSIANAHDVFVVEDNAQAHGAKFNHKMTGSFGDMNATSFYPGKNLGALGEAGALTTNDSSLAEKASVIRNYGSQKKYYNEIPGHNMRMDECQAAFLSIKLKYMDAWTMERKDIAAKYHDLLKNIEGLQLPFAEKGAEPVFHIYAIRTTQRDALQEYLQQQGIGTLIHYPVPIHLQKAYSYLQYKKGDFPNAELIADTTLSLPIWPGIQTEQIEFVCTAIRNFYSTHG